ncbi:hypothetical protein AHF37_01070 [Paragonimus kellicotti]|nr:hypothetical protein AHF37_01070 [Paragonimus kellicotti]
MNYEIIPSDCDLVSDTTCSSHVLPDTTNMFDTGTDPISSSNLSPPYSVVDDLSSTSSVADQYMPRTCRAPIQPQVNKPKLGTYEIDRTIGKGIFSVVKLARHTITGLNLAIKLIDKTRLDNENLIKIYRESEILKKLHHPNIVRLYQVMETPKLLCIVMEYLPNGEVFDYIATRGRFSEAEARVKFLDVLSAVDYAHSCGIVHRDLKAENLLFDANMNIKLIDFSFGTHHPDSERPQSLLSTWCGSPPYAAPEIFKGEPYVGTKADIWVRAPVQSLSRRAYDHLMATYLLLGEKIRQKRFSLNLSNLAPNSLNELVVDNRPVDSKIIPHRPWTVKHSRVDSAVDVKSSISEYETSRIPDDFSASLPDSEVGIVPSAFLYSANTTLPAHQIRSWLPQSSDIPMEQIQQLPSCSEQLDVTDPMQLTMTWTIQKPLPSNRCLAIPSLDNPTQVLDESQLTTHPWRIPVQNDLEDTKPNGPHTPPPLRRTLVRRKYGVFNAPAYLDQLAKAVMEQQRQTPPTTHTDPDDEDSTHQTINET